MREADRHETNSHPQKGQGNVTVLVSAKAKPTYDEPPNDQTRRGDHFQSAHPRAWITLESGQGKKIPIGDVHHDGGRREKG